MSLSQIEAFVAVAEEGSISAAALRLHISQPPLTRKIRSLEDELGQPLFVRKPRGMALSSAGERFLEPAMRVLESVADARRVLIERD